MDEVERMLANVQNSQSMFGPAMVRGIWIALFDEHCGPYWEPTAPALREPSGWRESAGPYFLERVISAEMYDGGFDVSVEEVCPICGSSDVETQEFGSYGGTSEGYSSCNFCGYSKSWADISAVI